MMRKHEVVRTQQEGLVAKRTATTTKAERTKDEILKQIRALAEELQGTDRHTAVEILCVLQEAEDRRNGKAW